MSPPSPACLRLTLSADAGLCVYVCGPMGISRLLLWGRKCERGMNIALIVFNPQRRRATSARRQGKAKSHISACFCVAQC